MACLASRSATNSGASIDHTTNGEVVHVRNNNAIGIALYIIAPLIAVILSKTNPGTGYSRYTTLVCVSSYAVLIGKFP